MSKIATIRTFVGSKLPDDQLQRQKLFERAFAVGKKLGYAFHRDGRCYVPEAKRGVGVGYGCHGKPF